MFNTIRIAALGVIGIAHLGAIGHELNKPERDRRSGQVVTSTVVVGLCAAGIYYCTRK
ncbi:hypothetical protein MZD04_gp120 [Pseudomonas phage Psa21]|uniref:Uncharacterized protein n=1 Tax=Pseudomonas phage Psa21 TaxID=2530023 RepID=A0A481W4S7_9CAUD|nr:hypothetical protein MZD04_gp120 [Pseudomonas phage Psa21]QBJ02648.1 hypothetical protein PSA21_120 [Pseudomonas phage Psa21]